MRKTGSNSLIVIPTYNERENIKRLVEKVLSLGIGVSVLVIDDNSPDRTWEIVKELTRKHDNIYLERRPQKLGLGRAYSKGFDFAIERNFLNIITMDADFSHDPAVIPSLLEKAGENDLVIGSRYLKGGAIKNWSFFRLLLSKSANILARELLGSGIKDWTSGYRCYRREALEKIDFKKIKTSGYSFLVEILLVIKNAGLRIKEIPIVFEDRQLGKSKISKKEIIRASSNLIRLAGKRFIKACQSKLPPSGKLP